MAIDLGGLIHGGRPGRRCAGGWQRHIVITVGDDLPINNATSVTGAVDEDSLNNVSGAFGSLGNLDAVNVGTVAGGSLAGLVTVGADEPATFGFAGSFAGLTAQALTSKGRR